MGSCSRVALVVVLCVVGFAVLLAVSREAEAGTHYLKDPVITADETWRDGTWVVEGDLSIRSSSILTLENVTLRFVGDSICNLFVTNSQLRCSNSSVTGPSHGFSVYVTGTASFYGTSLHRYYWDHDEPLFHHFRGRLVLVECDLRGGSDIIYAWDDLEVTNCTFSNFSANALLVEEHGSTRLNISVLNSTFLSRNRQGVAVNLEGEPYTDFWHQMVVRDCTMRDVFRPVWVRYVFGKVLIEGNRASDVEAGPFYYDTGDITSRHNEWAIVNNVSYSALSVTRLRGLSMNISNESLSGGYIGLYLHGRWGSVAMHDLTISNVTRGIQASNIWLTLHDCRIRARERELVASGDATITLFDCDHTRNGAVFGLSAHIVEYLEVRFDPVTWNGGSLIEDGWVHFKGVQHGPVASWNVSEERPVPLMTWTVNATGELHLNRTYAVRHDRGVPFHSEAFNISGPKKRPLVIIDDSPPQLHVHVPAPGERVNGWGISVGGNFTELGSGLGTIEACIDGAGWKQADEVVGDSWRVMLIELVDGVHDIHVRTSDLSGNPVERVVAGVYTDTRPPSIELLEPGLATNRTPAMLRVRTEPDALVFLNNVELEVDHRGVSSYEVTLLEGNNLFHVRAIDTVWNENETTFLVRLDMEVPTLSVSYPLDGAWIPDLVFMVTGKASLDATVLVDGEEADRDGEGFSMLMDVNEGSHIIEVTARDAAGNVRTVGLEVNVDVTPPRLHIDDLGSGDVTSDPELRISGWAQDSGPVRVLVNGWIVPHFRLTFNYTLHLQEGPNDVTIEAIDEAGNSATVVHDVWLDSKPPLVTATLTIGEDSYREGSGRILTNSTQATLWLAADEACLVVVAGVGEVQMLPGSKEMEIELNENGFMTLAIQVLDSVGNSVARVLFTVDCDTRPPELAVQRPADGSTLSSSRVTIQGSTEAGAYVEVNGLPVPVDEGGRFSIEHELVRGRNMVRVSSRDAAGNRAVEELRLTYEPEEFPYTVLAVVGGIAIVVLGLLLLFRRRLFGGRVEEGWVEVPD